MKTYREQAAPFVDFQHADFRYDSEWLAPITLPQFLGVLEKLPVVASLQREDFRNRLAAGSGLTMAELVYSVVMALASVEIAADIELGGLDQLLNMQMCRRVMENTGQTPEIIVATGLIEGTDGAVHGLDAAAACRAGFKAQFSQKRFSDTPGLPVVDRSEHADTSVGEVFVKVTRTVPSMNQVRRVAGGGGLRLVTEAPAGEQESVSLTEADVNGALGSLLSADVAQAGTRTFLKCGRFLVEVR